MTTEIESQRRESASLGRVAVALGGVALVVALAACTESASPTTTTTSTEAPPTTAATTTTTVAPDAAARAFIGAVGTDTAAALALVAADADVKAPDLDDIADLDAWLDWNVAIGWEQTVDDCDESDGEIRCAYTYTNPWMDAVGSPPGSGGTYTFTIENGIITSFTERLSFPPLQLAWDTFRGWLDRTYGSEGILTPDEQPILTPEAIALWERYTNEFVEAMPNEALGRQFIEAFMTFDAGEVRALGNGSVDLDVVRYLQGFSAESGFALSGPVDCTASRSQSVTCVILGTDELADLLGASYEDTFAIRSDGAGAIRSIQWATESNPRGVVDAFLTWTMATSPDLFTTGGACAGFFSGGTTPGACALALIDVTDAYLEATSED